MRYAIITNPIAGRMNVDQKRLALAEAAKILNAEIYGLDATTVDDLIQCAGYLASRYDVVVAAGGDGTFADIINAVDTTRTPVAFLPLGSGNAIQYALNYRGSLADIARRIKDGKIYEFDLIDCDGTCRAFMVSIGLDGAIIKLRNQYISRGTFGFKAYFKAVLKAYFKTYKITPARIILDDTIWNINKLLNLMVVKQPYYGYGLNVVPRARFDDQLLHLCCISSGLIAFVIGAATAFTIGNRTGRYYTGKKLTIHLQQPLFMQANGNAGWKADTFCFTVLPGQLKIKC